MVLGVPEARDRRSVRAEWKEEKEAVLVHALQKGKPGSSPSCHGGGEVAAAELAGAAWRVEQGSSTRGSGSRRSLGCRVGWWAKQEEACGLPRRRAAPLSAGGGEAEREAGG